VTGDSHLSLATRHPSLMKALLIPIKDPANAKTRLAPLLAPAERRRLAWAMFEDVSRAVADITKADSVCLVSSFAPAIEQARRAGWEVLVERAQAGESASALNACWCVTNASHLILMSRPTCEP
jgi:2-phospho-L-lactate/phosphoenolpyruvate guanylyltransferase